jgi:hypothetical protein
LWGGRSKIVAFLARAYRKPERDGYNPWASTISGGSLFVQPVWLGWGGKHYDVSAGYGFCALAGEDNIGLGFWTHQLQAAGAWYPFENCGTAVTVAGTYEIHHEMEDRGLIHPLIFISCRTLLRRYDVRGAFRRSVA